MCATSRLIYVVCMYLSNKVVKEKLMSVCLSSFQKMLLKKMHVSNKFLLQFQDEANRYIDIYHFGIEPVGFQTPSTLELLSKTIINPDCCKGKYPHVNMVA